MWISIGSVVNEQTKKILLLYIKRLVAKPLASKGICILRNGQNKEPKTIQRLKSKYKKV